jgi:hypothetical protein
LGTKDEREMAPVMSDGRLFQIHAAAVGKVCSSMVARQVQRTASAAKEGNQRCGYEPMFMT